MSLSTSSLTLAYLTPHDAKYLSRGERTKLHPMIVSRVGSIILPTESVDRLQRINAMLQAAVNNQLASSSK